MEACTPLSSAIAAGGDGIFRKLGKHFRTLKIAFACHFRMKPQVAAFSIQGRNHSKNQDAVMSRSAAPCRVAVADGISSCWKSEIASQLAVEAFEGGGPMNKQELFQQLLRTDRQVRELFRKLDCPEDEGGQSTLLVAEMKNNNRVTLLHVGDSRAYLMTRKFFGGYRVRQITRDQTCNGIMYQAIGFGIHRPAELLHQLSLPAGSTLILATDGVFKGMDDPLHELAEIAGQHHSLEGFVHGIVSRGACLCTDDSSAAAIRTAMLPGARLSFWLALCLSVSLLFLSSGR